MIANALGVVKRQILIRSADQKVKKDCECTRCHKTTNLETIRKYCILKYPQYQKKMLWKIKKFFFVKSILYNITLKYAIPQTQSPYAIYCVLFPK